MCYGWLWYLIYLGLTLAPVVHTYQYTPTSPRKGFLCNKNYAPKSVTEHPQGCSYVHPCRMYTMGSCNIEHPLRCSINMQLLIVIWYYTVYYSFKAASMLIFITNVSPKLLLLKQKLYAYMCMVTFFIWKFKVTTAIFIFQCM